MDTEDIESLVEDLGGNIDDLEATLQPILKSALSATASKLPLLDKAKLYVLATYAIESILFSALRLNGTDAKSHPIFQELSRVKEYFAKIKTAESAGAKRSTTVDKEAAGRFIKHGLAGNERYDKERAERQAREKAGAKRRLEDMSVGTHTRFDGAAKRIRASGQDVAVVRAQDVEDDDDAEVDSTGLTAGEPQSAEDVKIRRAAKRARRLERRQNRLESRDGQSRELDEGDGGDVLSGLPVNEDSAVQASVDDHSSQAEGKKSKKRKRKSRGQMARDLEDTRADEMK